MSCPCFVISRLLILLKRKHPPNASHCFYSKKRRRFKHSALEQRRLSNSITSLVALLLEVLCAVRVSASLASTRPPRRPHSLGLRLLSAPASSESFPSHNGQHLACRSGATTSKMCVSTRENFSLNWSPMFLSLPLRYLLTAVTH